MNRIACNQWRFHVTSTVALFALVVFFAYHFATYVHLERLDSALVCAVNRNDTAGALVLLMQGADPDAAERSRNEIGFMDSVVRTFRRIFHLGPAGREARNTALLLLCKPKRDQEYGWELPAENIALLRALLERGASVNRVDCNGYSPLAYAVAYGDWATAKILVQYGANVNARGCDDQPILTSAVTQPALVQRMLANGAEAGATSRSGVTPLMVAAEYDEVTSVRLLLAYGARADAADRYGSSALDYADENYGSRCALVLLNVHQRRPPRTRAGLH
jgi:ankyrin repeat protein